MKKTLLILVVFYLGIIFSGCPDGTTTYKTIKSVRGVLFSFNEFGVFPETDNFNRNELGVSVYPDSISESYEIAQTFSLVNNAYAMENPNKIIYTNAIDSINVFTIYDFDEEHPAGSNVNDILLSLDSMGDTERVNIDELSAEYHSFKFSAIPQNDTLQFEITGRITNEPVFTVKTELVILD